jgi:hypothetical protein
MFYPLWNVALCSLVDINKYFRGAYCIALVIETVSISETSVHFDDATSKKTVIFVLAAVRTQVSQCFELITHQCIYSVNAVG